MTASDTTDERAIAALKERLEETISQRDAVREREQQAREEWYRHEAEFTLLDDDAQTLNLAIKILGGDVNE